MDSRTIHALTLTALVSLSLLIVQPARRLAAQDADKVLNILGGGGEVQEKAAVEKRDEAQAKEAPPKGPRKATGAENEANGETKERGPQPVFHFRDKSKVAGFPGLEWIEVETSYGLLKIPTAELVRVRFARRVGTELKERITQLIEQLGDEDFDVRETAAENLAEIGPEALPALRKAVKSDSEEVKRKAEELLKEIYGQDQAGNRADESDGLPPLQGTDDEIISTRMTIKGRVTQERFLIRSRYGTLEVDTSMLSGIVFRVVGPSARKVSVASTFQPPGNWFDTKLNLEREQRFKIAASGIITVSNYGVSAGPDGSPQYSTSRSFQSLPVLSLVGRIGRKGRAFLDGSNHKGKASSSGKLYLAITPFYYNPAGAIGNYQVKIDVAGGSK